MTHLSVLPDRCQSAELARIDSAELARIGSAELARIEPDTRRPDGLPWAYNDIAVTEGLDAALVRWEADLAATATIPPDMLPRRYRPVAKADGPGAALDRWEADLAAQRDRWEADLADATGREWDKDKYGAPPDAWPRVRLREISADEADARAARVALISSVLAPLEAELAEASKAARAASREVFGPSWPANGFAPRPVTPQQVREAARSAAILAEMAEQFRREQAATPDPVVISATERKAIAADRRREAGELRRAQRMGLADIPDNGTLESHLLWLYTEFGDREFSTTKVRNVALENPDYRKAPGQFQPTDPDYTKQLGMSWAKVAGVLAGDMWLDRSDTKSAGAWRWRVMVKDG